MNLPFYKVPLYFIAGACQVLWKYYIREKLKIDIGNIRLEDGDTVRKVRSITPKEELKHRDRQLFEQARQAQATYTCKLDDMRYSLHYEDITHTLHCYNNH